MILIKIMKYQGNVYLKEKEECKVGRNVQSIINKIPIALIIEIIQQSRSNVLFKV